MKMISKYLAMMAFAGLALTYTACDDDDDKENQPAAVYEQEDQMGRPGISTVFVAAADKDTYNTTLVSNLGAGFSTKFKDRLMALNPGYTTNLLGLDAPTFTGVLATDILTVSLTDPTTYYDGTNVLTGRKLDDDVIDVSLILIFGGPDAMANPGLISDNVDANDKAFSSTFPYLATPH
jgi:hypothetical protein